MNSRRLNIKNESLHPVVFQRSQRSKRSQRSQRSNDTDHSQSIKNEGLTLLLFNEEGKYLNIQLKSKEEKN